MKRSVILLAICLLAVTMTAGLACCRQNPSSLAEHQQASTGQASTPVETDGNLPLFPGVIESDVPDDIKQIFAENKIPYTGGYLVSAVSEDIITWYREHMPDWTLQDIPDKSGPGIRYFKKDSEGVLVYTQENFSEGKTLLVVASGPWSNIEYFRMPGPKNSKPPETEGDILVIKNLPVRIAPYNPETGTAGDLVFTKEGEGWVKMPLRPFGIKPSWKEDIKTNDWWWSVGGDVTFYTIKGAPVYAISDGIVDAVDYQEYTDDYEIRVKPSENSTWLVVYDHIEKVNLRGKIYAGEKIGEAGLLEKWGCFEIQINKNAEMENESCVCFLTLLDESVKDKCLGQISRVMEEWERFIGDTTVYDEANQPIPGCYNNELTPSQYETVLPQQ